MLDESGAIIVENVIFDAAVLGQVDLRAGELLHTKLAKATGLVLAQGSRLPIPSSVFGRVRAPACRPMTLS